MTRPTSPPPVPASVVEIERRIRWPALSALLFVAMMVALGVVALLGIRREPAFLTGLPDDPDVRAACDLMRDGVVLNGELRLFSALRSPAPDTAGAALVAVDHPSARPLDAVEQASVLLYRAHERNPRDPRIPAAIAAIELARGSLSRSERLYRESLRHAPDYGEARLGLGVTRATIGEQAADEGVQRRLLLQALAHVAAVRPLDPAFETALWDRVILLERVGRGAEARRLAREYRERYPASPWLGRMAGVIGAEE